jgi:cob(I)alamin adenosyltransferase
MRQGCVQVYTGEGKGKTTAATGLAVRAVGAGLRVFIGQFIKGSDSAEMTLLRARCPEMTIEQFGLGRFIKGGPAPEDLRVAHAGVVRLQEVLASGTYDVVIADEANGAVGAGVITEQELLSLIEQRPDPVELVITGRDALPSVIDRADLVSEMKKVKHCYDSGVPAREGMEF